LYAPNPDGDALSRAKVQGDDAIPHARVHGDDARCERP
jgi:hypothetical protein